MPHVEIKCFSGRTEEQKKEYYENNYYRYKHLYLLKEYDYVKDENGNIVRTYTGSMNMNTLEILLDELLEAN